MRVALIGTRGVPARYGGFETAVEEIGQRLADEGTDVLVYCRGAVEPITEHLGMELVHLPAFRAKALETLSHTFLSVLHLIFRRRKTTDVVILFNAANSVFLPLIRLAGIPVAVHVDGLEWKRAKWGKWGRRYYRAAESLAVRWADWLFADAQGIADYYLSEFGADTEQIAYGAAVLNDVGADRIREFGIEPRAYHVVVARFEPENHVLEIVRGYAGSSARFPLVVVGSAPYADDYTSQIEAVAKTDQRIRLIGGIWDQKQLDQLYANAVSYVHGHSVGGTNPSLLRAMGSGTTVTALDVSFNRGVLGPAGRFFRDDHDLAQLVTAAEDELAQSPDQFARRVAELRERIASDYVWDDVATAYEQMCEKLVSGELVRARYSGRRS